MAKPVPNFSHGQLEALAKALGATEGGLTGFEIGQLLAQVRVRDVNPELTKWKRLYNALAVRQNPDGRGDRVLAFIHAALDPVRYHGREHVFEKRRAAVNVTLAFVGLEYREDGKFGPIAAAATLSEAQQRAHRLDAALRQRSVHPDVLSYCRAELLQHDSFHAVLEATKSVAEKMRARTGLGSDGGTLVDQALGGDQPILMINAFSNDSERSEQRGFANLVKGLFGTFRNPTAHAPRIAWPMTEEDALDLLTLASYVHRRMDAAHN